jgi:hypothetical protein
MAPGASATFGVFLPAASTESSARVQVAVGVRDATGGPVIGDRATVLALTDLKAPDTELASWAADGTPSPRHANNPSVDSNGQRVAYDTFTDSIVLTDKNDHNDVFVWDRARWQTGIVGPAGGAAATDWSLDAQISANGRCVAFSSYANNMGPDANHNGDIFVKDLDTGAVQLASRYGAAYGNYSSEWATMCDDRYVAFHSYANNLAIGDANRQCDVFVFDRTTAALSLISCSVDGAPGNGPSWYPRTSASGRFVTFSSMADDLGSNPDTNSFEDAYIWDATTKTVELLSVGLSGAAAQGQTYPTGVSDDGRYVSLMSDASDLPGGLRDGRPHLYLLDRTERVFYPAERWLDPETPSAAVNYFTVGDDGEWLALGSQRELGVGDQRLLETRLELVQRTTGRCQTVATGLRGPGASRDGFSEVHGSLAGLLGQRRFLVFQGDGREGREFIQQAYLFDRAQPRVEVQFGRTSDRLRRSTDAESNPLLRELQLLVTPGTPAMFHLVLRNAGEFADTLELTATQMAAEWQLALQVPPGNETLALPLSFSNLAAQAEVALGGALVLSPGIAPSPVELTLRSAANRAVMEHIRIQPLLDSDADQMADVWELEHFGNLTAATAGTDADHDGQTDRDEFLTGTHPAAAQPPLALSAVALLPDGRLRLEWPAVADRVYLVQRSAALDLPFASRGEPIPGRAGAIEFLDTLDPGTSAAFYRILVELP